MVVGASAQNSRAELETSETIFVVLTAINSCGYDQDLAASDAVRAQVRKQFADALEASSAASLAQDRFCTFYRDKVGPGPSRTLSQYLSLALNLEPPPSLAPSIKEADMPPDASEVLGAVPLLQRLYAESEMHTIWLKHYAESEAQIARMQGPLTKLLDSTDAYLRLPLSGYLGRRFVIYLAPMGAPSQVNARNYGSDYFVVMTPAHDSFRAAEVRHTYLHFLLDPMMQRRASTIKRLQPLLEQVQTAPIEESFKEDAGLLTTESLIRAIEARIIEQGDRHIESERQRLASVDESMHEGFVLTKYFYGQLVQFEKGPTGLRDAFPDMLAGIDVAKEVSRAKSMEFTAGTSADVLRNRAAVHVPNTLDLAEERLAQNDPEGAHRLAQQALDENTRDEPRALFIMARAATLNRDVDEAQMIFERTIKVAKDPRILAWSHIYLGRILDLKCSRAAAIEQYNLALKSGDAAVDTKAAVDKGLEQGAPRCTEKE